MSYYDRFKDVSILNGRKVKEVEGLHTNSDTVIFHMEDGSEYRLYHQHDCCESVDIEDIVGDAADLQDCTIISAEEVAGESGEKDWEVFEWTYYNFQTNKGHVQLRWYGSSNGYYSTSVSFAETKGPSV